MILTAISFLITTIAILFEVPWADTSLYITMFLTFLGGLLRWEFLLGFDTDEK
ncbi:MAG: hypothetical protein ACRC5T_02400 [Cetobacterium sp.]